MYGIIMTPPGRVKTQDDATNFLKNVRKVFRSWERSAAGIGAAFWVAECVVKWNEDPTQIPCPVQHSRPTFKESQVMNSEAKQAIETTIEECKSGGNCVYCRGRGVLPSVHLHAHAVVISDPFSYSSNVEGTYKQDFNGRHFEGLCEENGLGHQKIEVLRGTAGMIEYIAKSMLVYISKGTRVEKGESLKGSSVDWDMSAKDNLIASAIYGNSKAKGKNGRAYGVKASRKDANRDFLFGGDMSHQLNPMEGENGGFTALALKGHLGQHKKEKKLSKMAPTTEHPETMTVEAIDRWREERNRQTEREENERIVNIVEAGKKAVEGGGLGARALSVLKETQLDTPKTKIEEFDYVDDYYEDKPQSENNIFLFENNGSLIQRKPRKLGTNKNLKRWWNNAFIINADQFWFSLEEHGGAFIGRGSAVVYMPDTEGKTFLHIGRIIEMMSLNDYRHWGDIVISLVDRQIVEKEAV